MTAAERQARRRARFVDREPAVAALVELALTTRELNDLLTERGGPAADPELHGRYRAIVNAQESLAVALGMPSAWPHRRATYIRFQRAGRLPPDPPGRTGC